MTAKDGLALTITSNLWVYDPEPRFFVRKLRANAWNVFHNSGAVDVDYGTFNTRAEAVMAIENEIGVRR